jgi:hypothetical protein
MIEQALDVYEPLLGLDLAEWAIDRALLLAFIRRMTGAGA